jgi:hypothetical protein
LYFGDFIMTEQLVADMANPGGSFVTQSDAVVARRVDPLVTDVSTPIDFAAQFPTPLDPTEVIAMCEEINLLQAIPEKPTGLQQEIWRELNALAFTSGSNYIAFAEGACPEEYYHDGVNTTLNLKNLGAKKSLTISDILHSQAVVVGGSGIRSLLGGWDGSNGMPGGATGGGVIGLENIANLKEKEIKLGMTLVLNGEDRLLAVGNATSRPLEFSGIETQVTAANGAHSNSITGQDASGTFSASNFDAFLGEACAKPTHIFGHPQAIQAMMSGYFQLGFQGSQLINFNGGDRIVPGFSFAGFVQTGVGRLQVVADNNFTKTASGTNSFRSALYPLRMSHNGVPLVYRSTQIPLSLTDLTPGCSSVSFEIWKKTALVIKAMCAQNLYTFGSYVGRSVTTCVAVG